MNIQKGITLFLRKKHFLPGKFLSFLSNEFNILVLNIKLDNLILLKYDNIYKYKTIDIDEYQIDKAISENLFRLDILYLNVLTPINWNSLYELLLSKYENLIVFICCEDRFKLDVIPSDKVIFRQIFEIDNTFKENSNSINKYVSVFTNILTNDTFTIDNFISSYIRDKKIDTFLNGSSEI